MDAEQSKNFNDRLSHWVESQGFWFQARYSMAGTGMKGWALLHLMRLGFRLLILLLLGAVGFWIYLVKRTDAVHFGQTLRADLKAGLSASALDMRRGVRVQGRLEISRLAAEGGDATFFRNLEAKTIHCKMGLLDGVIGIWNPGTISITRLDVDLRAGADDAQSASNLAASVFRKSPTFVANAFQVADANVRWGYSERTEGAIESSVLTCQRAETGWRLNFKGGTFQQNWLQKLEIVNLVVVCDAAGLVFEKAELKQGMGTVDFSGLRIVAGERPQVTGTAKIRHLNLEDLLPPGPQSFVEGSFSGDFQVFGSTNSADGIGFEGQVVLGDKDVITLREQLHLLKALSVADYARNYHRIDFPEGSFHLKTLCGGMELTEVKLKAANLLTLEGSMKVRLPTQAEIQATKAQGAGLEGASLFTGDSLNVTGRDATKEESDFSLKSAAQEARRIQEGTPIPEALSLFDRLGANLEIRRLQSVTSERLSQMLRYEGLFEITLPGDAFERGRELQTLYPVDATSGRVHLKVPLEGPLYELTLKQAEEIYVKGKRQN